MVQKYDSIYISILLLVGGCMENFQFRKSKLELWLVYFLQNEETKNQNP